MRTLAAPLGSFFKPHVLLGRARLCVDVQIVHSRGVSCCRTCCCLGTCSWVQIYCKRVSLQLCAILQRFLRGCEARVCRVSACHRFIPGCFLIPASFIFNRFMPHPREREPTMLETMLHLSLGYTHQFARLPPGE